MKKIYKVGTYLELEVKYFGGLFGTILKKSEKGWLIRNIKYIYAESIEEALNKYDRLFGEQYESITGWGNWYEHSDNIDIWCHDKTTKIIDQYFTIVEENYEPKNIQSLKENMSAYDFRDWWHDSNLLDEEMLLEKEN